MAKFYDEFYKQEETGHDELVIRCLEDEELRNKILGVNKDLIDGEMQVFTCGKKLFMPGEVPLYLQSMDGDISIPEISSSGVWIDGYETKYVRGKDYQIYDIDTKEDIIRCVKAKEKEIYDEIDKQDYRDETYLEQVHKYVEQLNNYRDTLGESSYQFLNLSKKLNKFVSQHEQKIRNIKVKQIEEQRKQLKKSFHLKSLVFPERSFSPAEKMRLCKRKDTCDKKDNCPWLDGSKHINAVEWVPVKISTVPKYTFETEVVCRTGYQNNFVVGYADLVFTVSFEKIKNVYKPRGEIIDEKYYKELNNIRSDLFKQFKVLVEIKPQLKDIGSIIRQVKTYRELLDSKREPPINRTVIVTYSTISDGARQLLNNENIDCITVDKI